MSRFSELLSSSYGQGYGAYDPFEEEEEDTFATQYDPSTSDLTFEEQIALENKVNAADDNNLISELPSTPSAPYQEDPEDTFQVTQAPQEQDIIPSSTVEDRDTYSLDYGSPDDYQAEDAETPWSDVISSGSEAGFINYVAIPAGAVLRKAGKTEESFGSTLEKYTGISFVQKIGQFGIDTGQEAMNFWGKRSKELVVKTPEMTINLWQKPKEILNPKVFTSLVLSQGPMLAAGLATGGAATPIVVGAMGGMSMGASTYKEKLDEGASESEATTAGAVDLVLGSALEALGGRLIFGGGKEVIKRLFIGSMGEGATEYAQTMQSELNKQITSDLYDDVPWETMSSNIYKQLGEWNQQALGSGVAGGIIGGTGSAGSMVISQRKADTIIEDVTGLGPRKGTESELFKKINVLNLMDNEVQSKYHSEFKKAHGIQDASIDYVDNVSERQNEVVSTNILPPEEGNSTVSPEESFAEGSSDENNLTEEPENVILPEQLREVSTLERDEEPSNIATLSISEGDTGSSGSIGSSGATGEQGEHLSPPDPETGTMDSEKGSGVSEASQTRGELPVREADVLSTGVLKTSKDKVTSGYDSIIRNVDKVVTPISYRLRKVSPKLEKAVRRMEFNITDRTSEGLQPVRELFEGSDKWAKGYKIAQAKDKIKGSKKSKAYEAKRLDDKDYIDLALKNGDWDTIKDHVDVDAWYDLQSEFKAIQERAEDVGIKIPKQENYFPRVVEDHDGLADYLSSKGKAKELHLYDVDPLATIDKLASREIPKLNPEMNKFYHTAEEGAEIYVKQINESIEKKRLLKGSKDSSTDDTVAIEEFIADLEKEQGKTFSAKDRREIKDTLSARFGFKATAKPIAAAKSISYSALLAQPAAALTNIKDLAFTIYESKLNTTFRNQGVKLSDIADPMILEEYQQLSEGPLGKATNALFKASGFKSLDIKAKEVFLNSKLKSWKNAPAAKVRNELSETLGSTEKAVKVYSELKSHKKGDDLSRDLRFSLFDQLSDYQPISKSENAELYLKDPNVSRILYQMKTFALREANTLRRESLSKIRKGVATKDKKLIGEGVAKGAALLSLGVLIGVPVDLLKDYIRGKITSLTDVKELTIETMFDNILQWTVIVNRYGIDRATSREDGFKPYDFAKSTLVDLFTPIIPKADIGSVPIVGQLAKGWSKESRVTLKRKEFFAQLKKHTLEGDPKRSEITILHRKLNNEIKAYNRGKEKDDQLKIITMDTLNRNMRRYHKGVK